MIASHQSYAKNSRQQPFFWPVCASLAGHLLLVGFLLFSPTWDSEPEFFPSVIDVQMVDLSELAAAPAQEKKADVSEEKAPVVEEKKADDAPQPAVQTETEKKPEVSVAPPPKKATKSALKYKTYKSKKVIKNALKRVENKVESTTPKPLEDTIKRLREKVAKEGRTTAAGDSGKQSDKTGKNVGQGRRSKQQIELIDLYQMEIAHMIQKNWAFASQLSGDGNKLMVSIVFKVMPDGEIKDVFFMDRSGNPYLDDSAFRAIKKSSPVRPHPEKLSLPFMEMGLQFTPEGVQ